MTVETNSKERSNVTDNAGNASGGNAVVSGTDFDSIGNELSLEKQPIWACL
jgi:hypothetical protein